MSKEKHDNSKHCKSHHVQQAGLEETKVLAEQGASMPQRHPLIQQISRMANIPNPGAHAAILNCAPANQLSSNRQLLLQLQRQYGNSYVQQVMQQMHHMRELVPSASRQQPLVQAKLTIGEPGSKYEREADKVARQVVQFLNAPATVELAHSQTVQRQAKEENKEDSLQMKPVVQLQADTEMAAAPDLEASINQARGSGQPLADNIREPMEQAFGADFSGVKVHTDTRADCLSKSIQAKAFTTHPQLSLERRPNKTGLPDALKAGVENLSGYSLDDVRVHYNSPKPAQLQALAYTQGTEIHVAPRQEEHLPHEAWHVVQQKQGRVRPKLQVKGATINDDQSLENEADMMGKSALQMKRILQKETDSVLYNKTISQNVLPTGTVVQKRNGAIVDNWHTISIKENKGFITHTVGWGSSTGNINELDDVQTREEVTWAAGCPWAMEPAYQAAGQHHGMGSTPGNIGQNRDVHQASQPYFDTRNPPLAPGQTMHFVMQQVYQYSIDRGATWHNIPHSNYTLTRSLYRRKWPLKNQFVYKLTKRGISDAAVDKKTKITVRL